MKYHTIGSSNVSGEAKKSGFTIYADMDVSQNKMAYTEIDMKKVREELETVQKALKLQTKRCRQLVTEYTRRLQEKEELYHNEKGLRDTQLAKVLKALLIFEARLRQEQKYISHQLNEKDYIIKTQTNDIKKLLASQYCKNCNQFYAPSPVTLESFDSSSEYVATEQDYQSSNFESLDSSSETYGTLSERGYTKSESEAEEKIKEKHIYQKNRYNSQGRRKIPHRKSIGTYFEVLKLRNDSPLSNEDNTSADYDNFDSLPPESISDKISVVSENIDNILNKSKNVGSTASESSINITSSECGKTVINTNLEEDESKSELSSNALKLENINNASRETEKNEDKEKQVNKREIKVEHKLTETIPEFEGGGDANDNWYASASDQEDEEHGDIYRNNPVLECMNQILLQNINDINSPPKTPNIERKTSKNNKRVKFSDEEDKYALEENVASDKESQHDYYETPVQKIPNFYETPQSIYSNDYEQILSKCSETFSDSSKPEVVPRKTVELKVSHHYIEMEKSPEATEGQDNNVNSIVRKNKILRVPPALPPKPPNLVSKYKIQNIPKRPPSDVSSSVDLEPDYCSISELNLPQNKNVSVKKISVVAEVHSSAFSEVKTKVNLSLPMEKAAVKKTTEEVALVNNGRKEEASSLVVKKCVEKLNIQLAKQTPVRSEVTAIIQSPKKKNELEIPKLPQVSEIIIPDDPEENEEERISQDNYVKNNTQILQSKNIREPRKPILMGSTVSSLISGFNNHQILNEIKNKHERIKPETKKAFSSFENLQNLDKHFMVNSEKSPETPSFENFDLSQNFEEFKLDDCEIEEYDVEEELNKEEQAKEKEINEVIDAPEKPPTKPDKKIQSTRVDFIRATKDMTVPNLNQKSIEVLKKQLELQRLKNPPKELRNHESKNTFSTEPTYEHFLECTGLSSKSILTSARMMSNHKNMLKPKDVKLRSKVKTNTSIFERHSGTNIKYWSEPFV